MLDTKWPGNQKIRLFSKAIIIYQTVKLLVNSLKTFKSISLLLIISPQGTNKMGFIDSVSAALQYNGWWYASSKTIWGNKEKRSLSCLSSWQQTAAHLQGHRETRETHLVEGVDVLVSVRTARLQFTIPLPQGLQTEHMWNVLEAHFSLSFLLVISAKLRLLWLQSVVSIGTSVCVCSQYLFVKKLKGSEYTLVQSWSSDVRTFFAKSLLFPIAPGS